MGIVNKILNEAGITQIFDDVNRYAFVWRDANRFVSVEEKKSIVRKMETYVRTGGKGLPSKRINPQLIASTAPGEVHGMPIVVKLNMSYYCINGMVKIQGYLTREEDFINVKLMDLDDWAS